MQAQVELVKMAGRRAKDPRELKGLLRELDERKKAAEEVGHVDEGQLKTTLVMMLDGETRKYTVVAQRKGYEELREGVNEFLRAVHVGEVDVSGGKKDVAAIGMCGDPWKVDIGS